MQDSGHDKDWDGVDAQGDWRDGAQARQVGNLVDMLLAGVCRLG